MATRLRAPQASFYFYPFPVSGNIAILFWVRLVLNVVWLGFWRNEALVSFSTTG